MKKSLVLAVSLFLASCPALAQLDGFELIDTAQAWPETANAALAAYEPPGATTLTNLGANLRTVWRVDPGASLGSAAPLPAASVVGFHVRDNLGVLAEFGVAADAGNQVAGLWCGYLYRNWIFPAIGLDSRYLFEQTGIGPSGAVSFIVPLTGGSAGRLEARYSWFGKDGGSQMSLGFGYLGSF